MTKWLFIRNYLLMVLLILGIGRVMDNLLISIHANETLTAERGFIQGSFLYIASALTEKSETIEQLWHKKQQLLQDELGYPLALYHLSDFSDTSPFITHSSTSPVTVLTTENEGVIYYNQLKNSDYIIALGPVYEQNKDNKSYDLLLITFYHILVASVLFLWFLPLARDLQKLRTVAGNFGAENFSARITLSKNSSIALVADAFNGMAQRIQTLVLAHKELTHAVSHELKTPLARFKFSLEIIEELEDKQKRCRYLDEMKQDVRELDALIEEMLGYAQLDGKNLQLNLEKVYLKPWLEKLVRLYAQEKITVNLIIEPKSKHNRDALLMDKHLMERAVHNLIRNGLRYAKNNVQLSLQVDFHTFKLRVDDDGQGIPEQSRVQILQPFVRLESSRDKQSGGYGLGLAIVNKIVQQHGGKVIVDCSSLGGAGFCIELPR